MIRHDDDDDDDDDGTARKGTTVQAWTCSRRGKDRRGLGSALVDMATYEKPQEDGGNGKKRTKRCSPVGAHALAPGSWHSIARRADGHSAWGTVLRDLSTVSTAVATPPTSPRSIFCLSAQRALRDVPREPPWSLRREWREMRGQRGGIEKYIRGAYILLTTPRRSHTGHSQVSGLTHVTRHSHAHSQTETSFAKNTTSSKPNTDTAMF